MTLYKLVLFAGVVQGFLLTSSLFIRFNGKKKQNPYFLLLLLLLTLVMLVRLIYSPQAFRAFPHIWYIPDIIAYLIAPFWYFSIKNGLYPEIQVSRTELIYLSPILYHLIFLVYIFVLDKATLLGMNDTPWFSKIFYGFCISVFIVNGLFLGSAHKILEKNKGGLLPRTIVIGQYILLGILSLWILSFLLSFLFVGQDQIVELSYSLSFLSFSFLFLGMAFWALVKPELLYILFQPFRKGEMALLEELAQKIEKHLLTKQSYLSPNYKLSDLAREVEANPVISSKAINKALNTSFNDLINKYRIKHFLDLARNQDSKHLTHWAIAQMAGFGNKVSFYKAFKKQYNSTPKAYLSQPSTGFK